MRPVRRLAVRISSGVVRWASPGCKEWAEGLEREAAVIESDWAALGWAIGSTRILLDRRPALLTSLDDVPKLLQRLVEQSRSGANMWLMILYGPLFLWKFFEARGPFAHTGYAIVVLASIIAGTFLLLERHRLKEPWKDDIYDDLIACTNFYKTQLRHRDRLWIPSVSYFCFCFGLFMSDHDVILLVLFCGLFFLFIPPLMQQRRQNNLRRIEEIDALLAEQDGVNGL